MTYRPGDRAIPEGRLRLSVGALAEIADVFGAQDPEQLATSLRTLDAAGARRLLACLTCSDVARERVLGLSDGEVGTRLPGAVACVSVALQ